MNLAFLVIIRLSCLQLIKVWLCVLFFVFVSEVSKTEGRVGQTTNVVIGGTVADDSTNEWLDLDQKVCLYWFYLNSVYFPLDVNKFWVIMIHEHQML